MTKLSNQALSKARSYAARLYVLLDVNIEYGRSVSGLQNTHLTPGLPHFARCCSRISTDAGSSEASLSSRSSSHRLPWPTIPRWMKTMTPPS